MTENIVSGAPYIAVAAVVVQLQKALKNTSYYRRFVAAFPGADKWAHWVFAAVASLVGATGIHIAWTGTAVAGGTIVTTIPPLADLLHGLWDWFTVYILQHTIYEGTHQKANPPGSGALTDPNITKERP